MNRILATALVAALVGTGIAADDHQGPPTSKKAASPPSGLLRVESQNQMVRQGADVKAVNREGKTTADMANGPVQRIQPWPEALALLEKLGAKNNHKCVSC